MILCFVEEVNHTLLGSHISLNSNHRSAIVFSEGIELISGRLDSLESSTANNDLALAEDRAKTHFGAVDSKGLSHALTYTTTASCNDDGLVHQHGEEMRLTLPLTENRELIEKLELDMMEYVWTTERRRILIEEVEPYFGL